MDHCNHYRRYRFVVQVWVCIVEVEHSSLVRVLVQVCILVVARKQAGRNLVRTVPQCTCPGPVAVAVVVLAGTVVAEQVDTAAEVGTDPFVVSV